MAFLYHRFNAAQLPTPHTDTVALAAQRLAEAYNSAVADHCK